MKPLLPHIYQSRFYRKLSHLLDGHEAHSTPIHISLKFVENNLSYNPGMKPLLILYILENHL
jgi:hypothetical protein